MCTSFVCRGDGVIVGMNFDNDGKDFKVSAHRGQDFLVSVKVNQAYFPSIGISRSGLFVNDLMVDSNGRGQYKRQNNKRWITTSLVEYVMGNDVEFEAVRTAVEQVEIVNAPQASTHVMIVDRFGRTGVVEPGRSRVFSDARDSTWQVMTNFPLSDYAEIVPSQVEGGGSDRYLRVLDMAASLGGKVEVEQGFEILRAVRQTGPAWNTELSLIYDGSKRELYYCLDQDFARIMKYDFESPAVFSRSH